MKKRKVGDVIITRDLRAQRARDGKWFWFWIVVPEGMSDPEALETQELHGPFASEAECKENRHATLLGPGCQITDCGEWNPAWGDIRDLGRRQ
jgi:hypothetical protein